MRFGGHIFRAFASPERVQHRARLLLSDVKFLKMEERMEKEKMSAYIIYYIVLYDHARALYARQKSLLL